MELPPQANVHPVFHVSLSLTRYSQVRICNLNYLAALMFRQYQRPSSTLAGDARMAAWWNKFWCADRILLPSTTSGKAKRNCKLAFLMQRLGGKPHLKEGMSRPMAGRGLQLRQPGGPPGPRSPTRRITAPSGCEPWPT